MKNGSFLSLMLGLFLKYVVMHTDNSHTLLSPDYIFIVKYCVFKKKVNFKVYIKGFGDCAKIIHSHTHFFDKYHMNAQVLGVFQIFWVQQRTKETKTPASESLQSSESSRPSVNKQNPCGVIWRQAGKEQWRGRAREGQW